MPWVNHRLEVRLKRSGFQKIFHDVTLIDAKQLQALGEWATVMLPTGGLLVHPDIGLYGGAGGARIQAKDLPGATFNGRQLGRDIVGIKTGDCCFISFWSARSGLVTPADLFLLEVVAVPRM